jgi:hypothetical protein
MNQSPTLLTNRAARDLGISRHQLAGPKFLSVMTGVHVDKTVDVDLRLRCSAAMLVMPESAVFSHWTAVRLLGGPSMGGPDWLEVSVPSSTRRPRRPELRGSRRRLPPSHVIEKFGYPLTTPARTFLDLAETTSRHDLVAVGDWLRHKNLATDESLQAFLNSCGRYRGIVNARAAALLLDSGADSPPESLLRMKMLDAGLPRPRVNVDVFDELGGWIARPDFSYEKAKIAIEYEGIHHLDPDQYRRDAQRDQLMAGLGWVVLRATARDLRPGSSTLIDSIRTLLATRG